MKMNTSEQIDQLATALSAAQGAMKAAPMSGKNPTLNNKYSTLNDIIDTARPALAANGLSYVQMATSPEDAMPDTIGLTTRLMHKSGQWLESQMQFPVGEGNRGVNKTQVAGSVITYMRRYALAAMLGIAADEDVDGTQPQQKRDERKPQQAPQQAPPKAQPMAPPAVATNRVYADGSPVDVKAVESYDAYVKVHNGNAPDNVHNLRNWFKSQNGKQPAPVAEATEQTLFPVSNGAYEEN